MFICNKILDPNLSLTIKLYFTYQRMDIRFVNGIDVLAIIQPNDTVFVIKYRFSYTGIEPTVSFAVKR